MKRLLIISHTGHYKTADGGWVGLSSTVSEINHLLEIFDVITHIGMWHEGDPPRNMLPYASDRIRFVPLKALGGKSPGDKLRILINLPGVLRIIRTELKKHDLFQFRAPTGIGVFVIPYLICFSKKPGWFKYAGNWKQESPPLSYSLQRWMLKNQDRKVTINGSYADQPKHCLTFDNPCLNEEELSIGKSVRESKFSNDKPLDFCFVGRLEEAKGVSLMIQAFDLLSAELKEKVGTIHMIGDGEMKSDYMGMAESTECEFRFYGWLSRKEVHEVFAESHVIMLPSASEGLPKVIPEAMNYGCIPIISGIESLKDIIIHQQNGFVIQERNAEVMNKALTAVLQLTLKEKQIFVNSYGSDHRRYSYAAYNDRIINEIVV